ncbi:LOW QUALITY PROTEIN: pericentrin [Erpetoichthys calabaricus]|uniref:LOW QUALITY PROTEIN: pericentrin n=1 Tax=Erpetoichthys calabaricus TaxID=27687 RepID=UPI002234768F|nr:LOW QUALITY PROTEIN: pericentrin [Erpetoichthys calabaricus]
MDNAEREKKLQAGRAKLAHFRQRSSKAESSNIPKKTTKRKVKAVHTQEFQEQFCSSSTVCNQDECLQPLNLCQDTENTCLQDSSTIEAGDKDESVMEGTVVQVPMLCSSEEGRKHDLPTGWDMEEPFTLIHNVSHLQTVAELPTSNLHVVVDTEQLKNFSCSHNEMISQLTLDLQEVLQSTEMQNEAFKLTNLIQSLQAELQRNTIDKENALTQVMEKLKSTEEKIETQTRLIEEKEEIIQDLQQNLSHSTDAVSQLQCTVLEKEKEVSALKNEMLKFISSQDGHSLDQLAEGHEIDLWLQQKCNDIEVAQNLISSKELISCQLDKKFNTIQRESSQVEDQLKQLHEDLQVAEQQARESFMYNTEKDNLNTEVIRLNCIIEEMNLKLSDAEESYRQLKKKHEADVSSCENQLHLLEKEKQQAFRRLEESQETTQRLEEEISILRQEVVSKHDKHDNQENCHLQDIENFKEKLNEIKAKKAVEINEESNDSHLSAVGFPCTDDEEHFMNKYLTSTQEAECSWLKDGASMQSGNESSEHQQFELNSEIFLEENMCDSFGDIIGSCNLIQLSLPDNAELGSRSSVESFGSINCQKNACAVIKSYDGIDVTDAENTNTSELQSSTMFSELNNENVKQFQMELNTLAEKVLDLQDSKQQMSEELSALQLKLKIEEEERARCEEIVRLKSQECEDLKTTLNNKMLHHDKNENLETAFAIQELNDLKKERDFLLMQLRDQEELVKEVQQRKLAGDSVASEVQALFGRQLAVLQTQRDQLQSELDIQKSKNQTTSELLGERTLLVDSLRNELCLLKRENSDRDHILKILEDEKRDLEAKLHSVEQNHIRASDAFNQCNREKLDLEKNLADLDVKVKNLENIMESEKLQLKSQLNDKSVDLQNLEEQMKHSQLEYIQKESGLREEIAWLKSRIEDLEKAHNKELESLLHAETKNLEEAITNIENKLCGQFELETKSIEENHQIQLNLLNVENEEKMTELKISFQEEQKKLISCVKQVHEREHVREISELVEKHKDELKSQRLHFLSEQQELKDRLNEAHLIELDQMKLQFQNESALEREALRLSLTNLYTAQLELSQSNLLQEKESALSELRENLNDKRSQEVAMLQTRHHFEMEKVKEDLNQRFDLEIAELKTQIKEYANKLKLHEHDLETAKTSLEEMKKILSEKEVQIQDLKNHESTLLSRMNAEKEQAESIHEDLVEKHTMAITDLEDSLRQKYVEQLQILETKHRDAEAEQKKQNEALQRMYDDLKTHSDQEIKHLWSQLENTRTSRQELGELKEQLLARASHVEDIERLKQELTQQRLDLKSQHERELENLRTYFEQKLYETGNSYKEEIAHLHHRLLEKVTTSTASDSVDISSADEDIFNTERSDLLREMTEKLEQNKMELDLLRLKLEEKHLNELEAQRSTLTLKFKEDLLNMKTDLSDRYFAEIQELKTKHSLELEQLRARLSDSHIKEITKIRLQSAHDAAQQVEAEVAERLLLVKSEKQRIAQLEEQIESLKQENSEILKHLTETQQMFEKENTEIKRKLLDDLKQKVDEARKEESDKAAKILSEKDAELKQLQDELQSASEERITAIQVDLSKIAEQEREALVKEFEARELELKALQNKQEAIISELEKELKEERNQLQKLQDSLDGKQSSKIMQHENIQTEFDDELDISNSKIAEEMTLLKSRVEESQFKLEEAQNRFTEEKKLMADQLDKSLRELEAAQAEELEMMRRFLQEQHHKELVALEKELTAKHQIKMETVINDLQSAHRTRLQEVEQDLCKKHTMEMKEMENRFLSNIDTLESTYLSQIQSLRKEHDQTVNVLKSSHRDELQRLKIEDETTLADSLEKIKVEHEAQMISAMEQLKKELSMIHMEKFKAMAAEVEKVHKEELISHMKRQAAEMEAEHSKALGVLQTEVLRLEENHQATMLKLQKFHLEEVCRREEEYSQQLHSEMEKMKILHLEQLKECSNVSACEMDSLKEKLLAQFNEEKNIQQIRFQEEIELLKCQSEILLEQQISQLKEEIEAEKMLELEQQSVKFNEEQKLAETQHKAEVEQLNLQIQEQAELLTQLSNKMSLLQKEIDIKNSNQDTLLQRRERENEEAGNLITILRYDLAVITNERNSLQDAHDRIQNLLLKVKQSLIATEEIITTKIDTCMNCNLVHGESFSSNIKLDEQASLVNDTNEEKDEVQSQCSEGESESSHWSSITDKTLRSSQLLYESSIASPEQERENHILLICDRLRGTVEKLLELVVESALQVEDAHGDLSHLEAKLSHQNQLPEHLEESVAKTQLRQELKAETEKAALEEVLQQTIKKEHQLAVEVDTLRERLHDLSEEHNLLVRRSEAMAATMGDTEAGLLEEANRLAKEKLDLQCQAEKDRCSLTNRLKILENELEDQMNSNTELEDKRKTEVTDLKQQILALEKQLRNNRQFMDDQAVEREHERDEFQQEIKKLETQLKQQFRSNTGMEYQGQQIDDLILQVETLQETIKKKTDEYNILLLAKEQTDNYLTEQLEETEKLASHIRELEENVLSNAEATRKVIQLEQEIQRLKKSEMELMEYKEALQQQQYANRMQISALQTKLDETRHRIPEDHSDQVLKQQIEAKHESLVNKEKENAILINQIEHLERDLLSKSEELIQINIQLGLQAKTNTSKVNSLQNEIIQLKDIITNLQEHRRIDPDSTSSVMQLPQALLEEKNQEIDHLNDQLLRLQQEHELNNKMLEEKNSEAEDMKSQIERYVGDLDRLRQDKADEVERLHEVIYKLQEEIDQLGPNCHEISDSQEDLPLDRLDNRGSLQHELWQEERLQQELATEHIQLSDARVKELEQQMENACIERETLQQLLQKQEAHFRSEMEKLGKSLQNEKLQHHSLQEEYNLLKAHLTEQEAEAAHLSTKTQELEDLLRERECQLVEAEVQAKGTEEKRQAEILSLKHLPAKVADLEAELQKRLDVSMEADHLKTEKSLLNAQLLELNEIILRKTGEIEMLQNEVVKLQTHIEEIGSEKGQLFAESTDLKQKMLSLNDEVDRLKTEVTTKNAQIQDFLIQLEDNQTKHSGTERMLNCAEESLAKTETTLKERAQQLQEYVCKISELKTELEELKVELMTVKEQLCLSTIHADRLLEERQEKEKILKDLEIHNKNLKMEVGLLQEQLVKQEEKFIYQQTLLQPHPVSGTDNLASSFVKSSHPLDNFCSYTYSILNESSLESPELVRKYDTSLEQTQGYLSEVSTLHNSRLAVSASKSSPLERIHSDPADISSCQSVPTMSVSEDGFSLPDSVNTEKEKDFENSVLTPCVSPTGTATSLSVREWVSDGYGSNASSEIGSKLNVEPEASERLDASVVDYFRQCGMAFVENDDFTASHSENTEGVLSSELQNLLQKVYHEARLVLSLSEEYGSYTKPSINTKLSDIESWQVEKQALQEILQSLKEMISKMLDHSDKESVIQSSDWRREILQAVHSVLNNETEWFRAELQSTLQGSGCTDITTLLEKFESIMSKLEEKQNAALGNLLAADRRSMLVEIQTLQAELRISHLQNQERLQQLQSSLSHTEEQGNKREHQLRRQAELLKYKLQQEQAIVNDLQDSLKSEQDRSAELRSHFRSEQDAVADLKRELLAVNQTLETSLKKEHDLQKELENLRSRAECLETDLHFAEKNLEEEQKKVKEFHELLDQERLRNIQREDHDGHTQEVLRTSLEDRNIQNNQLCAALEQERVMSSNLRKELQIEQSRCEALISQERNKLAEAQQLLQIEKTRSYELSDAVKREQQRLAQEYCQKLKEEAVQRVEQMSQDQNLIHELQMQVNQEKDRSLELACMIEKTQQQAIQAKRQMESEAQQNMLELKKAQELVAKLQKSVETLQVQKLNLTQGFEREREQFTERLRSEVDKLQRKFLSVKEKEKAREEQMEKQKKQYQQELAEKERRHKLDSEKLHAMELQHQRDQQRLIQLQQTLEELEQHEKELASRKQKQEIFTSEFATPDIQTAEKEAMFLQQLKLAQQQVQMAVVRLKDVMFDCSSNGENEELKFVVRTLNLLDKDLQQLCCGPIFSAPSYSVDRLMKEKADLTNCVVVLTEEKTTFKRSIAMLEKEILDLKHKVAANDQFSQANTSSVLASERAAWQKEKAFLTSALNKAESELARMTAENENRPIGDSSSKIQRLYAKYLRTESFRKALVYQKKYLLLLLGGFQDTEREILSLIARMGVYPSPKDLQNTASTSRPISKFRSAVRVLIAISRLRFLVKKWQKATKKSHPPVASVSGNGHSLVHGTRTEVLRPQHSTIIFNSPPTRENVSFNRSTHIVQSPKSPYKLQNRSHEQSITSSQDAERSLTEYIHHLEAVQQRLGGHKLGSSGLSLSKSFKR